MKMSRRRKRRKRRLCFSRGICIVALIVKIMLINRERQLLFLNFDFGRLNPATTKSLQKQAKTTSYPFICPFLILLPIYFLPIITQLKSNNQKMSSLTRITNLISLLLLFFFLYNLQSSLQSLQQPTQTYLQIMQKIGHGQDLNEEQKNKIRDIGGKQIKEDNWNSPLCFVKAYYQVEKKGIQSQNVFRLFQNGQQEYGNVGNCSHYLSVLIYRAQQLQNKSTKDKILPILYQMQQTYLSSTSSSSRLHLYFYTHNGYSTLKSQFSTLKSQSYQNLKIFVQDDASTDESAMLIRYQLQGNAQIESSVRREKKGFFGCFREYLEQVEEEEYVVVVSGKEEMLGDSAMAIVGHYINKQKKDLIFFSSLVTPHLTLSNISPDLSTKSHFSPIFAIKKSLTKSLLVPQPQETISPVVDRNLLAFKLITLAKRQQVEIGVVNDAVVYRPAVAVGVKEMIEKVEMM